VAKGGEDNKREEKLPRIENDTGRLEVLERSAGMVPSVKDISIVSVSEKGLKKLDGHGNYRESTNGEGKAKNT